MTYNQISQLEEGKTQGLIVIAKIYYDSIIMKINK